MEWPTGEPEPTKYWLSTLAETGALDDLGRLVRMRWRIERDYQEMKDELGLDHYEGRGWRESTIMAPYVLPPPHSWRSSALGFPPLRLSPSCAPLPYPKVSARAALPLRVERHDPTSITTMRCQQARSPLSSLPHCPWCGTEKTAPFL